jgi:hypothetical protein
MKRVYLLVEGQTEETFVRELLAPHYDRLSLFLTPIIARTSTGYKGGVVSYAKIRPQIARLCKQDTDALVSTMFDLYALPRDFPGKNGPEWSQQRSGIDKAALVEREMARDIGLHNFIPYIQVHEFEALLFVEPGHFADWVDSRVVEILRKVRECNAPEDINDDPHTAPSKRILAAMPDYQKTVHGPLIACDIGLDVMRAACPHFAQWLAQLDALND